MGQRNQAASDKDRRKTKETGHSTAPNCTAAPSDGGAGLISLVGLVDS